MPTYDDQEFFPFLSAQNSASKTKGMGQGVLIFKMISKCRTSVTIKDHRVYGGQGMQVGKIPMGRVAGGP